MGNAQAFTYINNLLAVSGNIVLGVKIFVSFQSPFLFLPRHHIWLLKGSNHPPTHPLTGVKGTKIQYQNWLFSHIRFNTLAASLYSFQSSPVQAELWMRNWLRTRTSPKIKSNHVPATFLSTGRRWPGWIITLSTGISVHTCPNQPPRNCVRRGNW